MSKVLRLPTDWKQLRHNLVAAVVAAIAATAASFIAAALLGFFAGLALASLEMQHLVDWAQILVPFPSIGVGILLGYCSFRRVKRRSWATG